MTIALVPSSSTGIAFTWIDPAGVAHGFNSVSGVTVNWGPAGMWAPPVEIAERSLSLADGGKVRNVNVAGRTFDLPITIKGTTPSMCYGRIRDWMGYLNPRKGDGYLKVTDPDGNDRQIKCRYSGGLGLEESPDQRFTTWAKAVLSFRASDPYWYDTADTEQTFTLAATTGTAFLTDPFLSAPWHLGTSTVLSTATVTNEGDVEAWPVWEITGPGSRLVLRNLTSDQLLVLEHTLLGAETLVIDTRPGQPSVTDGAGTNLFGELSIASELWSLAPGSNLVQIEFNDATAASSVTLSWRQGYLTV